MKLPTFKKSIQDGAHFHADEYTFSVSHYAADSTPALQLYDKDSPLLTATVCIDGTTHEDGIIIKDYSENDGIAAALIEAKLIEPYPNEVLHASGYIVATEYRMINELKDAWDKHLAQML